MTSYHSLIINLYCHRPCKLSCEHTSFIVSVVVATFDAPGRATVSQDIYNDVAAADGGRLDHKYKQNDGNIDSTVRRLVPSSDLLYSNQPADDGATGHNDDSFGLSSSNDGLRGADGGANIGAVVNQPNDDEEPNNNVFTAEFSLDDAACQVSRKRGREARAEHEGGVSVSATSDDVVLGPGGPAFTNAALKRLIDSDSDDEYDALRNL